MRSPAILLATLLLALASAPAASAQLGGPNVPAPLTQQDPAPPAETLNLDDDNSLSTLWKALIFGGAAALLGLIAWYIVRDARRAAPVGQRSRDLTTGATGRKPVSARERERQQRAKRARAKAAKAQRKRNRTH